MPLGPNDIDLAGKTLTGGTVNPATLTVGGAAVPFAGSGTDLAIGDGGTGASTASGARDNLGLGTANNPQFATIELGNAADLTLSRIQAGLIATEGICVPPLLFKALDADVNGQNVNTVQPWFPSAGAVTVEAATSYFMEGLLRLVNGATTHTTGLSFTGTATLTSIDYNAELVSATDGAIATAISKIQVAVATNTVLNATSVAIGTVIRIRGIIRINGGGTLIPNFTFSAAPTGTQTVKRGTHFKLQKIGSNTVVSNGTWA